jgi:hypothetical protein
MSSDDAQFKREELFDLHEHYESVIKGQLDFFYKYLNFYVGLLSANSGRYSYRTVKFQTTVPAGIQL